MSGKEGRSVIVVGMAEEGEEGMNERRKGRKWSCGVFASDRGCAVGPEIILVTIHKYLN